MDISKKPIATCTRCAQSFTPKQNRQKYCSNRCKREQAEQWRAERERGPITEIQCPWCNKTWLPPNRKKKYCSDHCLWSALAERQRCKKGNVPVPESALCVQCGLEFAPGCITSKYCSPQCRVKAEAALRSEKRRIARESAQPVPCAQCEVPFVPIGPHQRFCSGACRKASWAHEAGFSQHKLAGRYQSEEHVANRIAASRKTLASLKRECGNCAEMFTPTSYAQRYCSGRCSETVRKSKSYVQASAQGRKRRPAVTREEYDRRFAEQKGICAICGNPPREGRRLSIDHCHDTNRIRGLLCDRCNTAIGLLKDNTATLKAAIEYLERNQ